MKFQFKKYCEELSRDQVKSKIDLGGNDTFTIFQFRSIYPLAFTQAIFSIPQVNVFFIYYSLHIFKVYSYMFYDFGVLCI